MAQIYLSGVVGVGWVGWGGSNSDYNATEFGESGHKIVSLNIFWCWCAAAYGEYGGNNASQSNLT